MVDLKDEQGSRHFSVSLPARVTDELDQIAAERGAKRSAVVREAVLFWLQKREVA